jgi:hypothetical protein
LTNLDDRYLDVNAHGVLRLPFELVLALLFLCRHWVLALLVTVSARRIGDTTLLLGSDFTWQVLAIEVPALFMATLCALRRPEAGYFVRKLWPFSKWFAFLTILGHIGYAILYLANSSYWLPWPELFLVSCALIDISIGMALFKKGHLSEVLAEFPKEKTSEVKK